MTAIKRPREDFQIDMVAVRLVRDRTLYSDEVIDSPQKAVRLLAPILSEYDREVVCVLHMDSAMRPVNAHIASIGALSEAMIHPREIMKAAVLSNASCIILFHNHPSGNLEPSSQDVRVTDRMIRACDILGIPLADHIIIGRNDEQCFSFREKGVLPVSDLDYKADYHDITFTLGKVAESRTEQKSLIGDLRKKEQQILTHGKDVRASAVPKKTGVEL